MIVEIRRKNYFIMAKINILKVNFIVANNLFSSNMIISLIFKVYTTYLDSYIRNKKNTIKTSQHRMIKTKTKREK